MADSKIKANKKCAALLHIAECWYFLVFTVGGLHSLDIFVLSYSDISSTVWSMPVHIHIQLKLQSAPLFSSLSLLMKPRCLHLYLHPLRIGHQMSIAVITFSPFDLVSGPHLPSIQIQRSSIPPVHSIMVLPFQAHLHAWHHIDVACYNTKAQRTRHTLPG